jgi:glycyl-tRNA synthetase beta chain
MEELYHRKTDQGLLEEFLRERMERYLQDKDFRYDEINAVLAGWEGNVPDARSRCEALREFRDRPEFSRLVIGQKRVRNIIKGAGSAAKVDEALIKEPAERSLVQLHAKLQPRLKAMVMAKQYREVLKVLLEMRPAIDKFFDDVLVMCEESRLRENRLAIVSSINDLFSQFADLSRIVIEGEKE